MSAKKPLLLVVAACSVAVWLVLNPVRSDQFKIYSQAMGETRRILVRLPERYGRSTASYPLLVLLDGGDQRQFFADRPLYSRSKKVLAALEKEGLPAMILVGVGNRDRIKDMTPVTRPDIYLGGGGSKAFIKFIEMELLPYVESRWRIGAVKILYGESYGGLFVLDAMVRGGQAFTDYIAVSPTVGVWPTGLAEAFRRRCQRPFVVRSLFVIYGERDAPLVTEYTPPFIREIESILPPRLRLQTDAIAGEGHTPASSLERGLRFIFGR